MTRYDVLILPVYQGAGKAIRDPPAFAATLPLCLPAQASHDRDSFSPLGLVPRVPLRTEPLGMAAPFDPERSRLIRAQRAARQPPGALYCDACLPPYPRPLSCRP